MQADLSYKPFVMVVVVYRGENVGRIFESWQKLVAPGVFHNVWCCSASHHFLESILESLSVLGLLAMCLNLEGVSQMFLKSYIILRQTHTHTHICWGLSFDCYQSFSLRSCFRKENLNHSSYAAVLNYCAQVIHWDAVRGFAVSSIPVFFDLRIKLNVSNFISC